MIEESTVSESVLVLSPTGRDAELISEALRKSKIKSQICQTPQDVCFQIGQGNSAALIIAEEALTDISIKEINSCLEKQEPWSDIPIVLMTAAGTPSQESYSVIRTFAPAGNVSLLERPFRPITLVTAVSVALRSRERQHQVRQLLLAQKEATRLRDEFISIASHELKTPLTSMKLQFQQNRRMAKNKNPEAYNPERIDKLLNSADQQIDRLGRLVEDMLDVSRIGTGKLYIEKSNVDLVQLVNDVVERIKDHMNESSLLHIESSGEIIGSWDAYRIEQVVSNLLTNAMRYAPGAPIEVKIENKNGHAVLKVIDQGPGIAPENQSRIFSRFERAVSSGNISGLGLGLYICREIVQRHNGSIHVESTPGHGATFVVDLPL